MISCLRVKENSIRVRVFQHTPSEPLGYFEQIFSENDIPVDHICLWDDDPVSGGDATHLMFLGGPMSVNDEEILTWIKEEKNLIREAVRKGIPVLGLCLGAQLDCICTRGNRIQVSERDRLVPSTLYSGFNRYFCVLPKDLPRFSDAWRDLSPSFKRKTPMQGGLCIPSGIQARVGNRSPVSP